jgi:hypothetical protein
VSGVEQCAQCHVRGTTSVDIVHGLAKPASTIVSASFSSIVQEILARPRPSRGSTPRAPTTRSWACPRSRSPG